MRIQLNKWNRNIILVHLFIERNYPKLHTSVWQKYMISGYQFIWRKIESGISINEMIVRSECGKRILGFHYQRLIFTTELCGCMSCLTQMRFLRTAQKPWMHTIMEKIIKVDPKSLILPVHCQANCVQMETIQCYYYLPQESNQVHQQKDM